MVKMTRTSLVTLLSIGLVAGFPGSALAQQAGGAVAPPGSGNATKISSQNQQNNAEYNQLIGAGDGVQKKGEGSAPRRAAAVPATAADIKPGSGLRDIKGVNIGTVVSVDATQAVVETGGTKIGVPLIAFGKDADGLLLGMTAAKFNDLVAKAKASN
jgi:hypothetical protein